MGQKISRSAVTDFSSKDYADTAAAQSRTLYPSSYNVLEEPSTSEIEYQNLLWSEQLGAYMSVSELAAMIDRKAQFVVGKGYKSEKDLSHIKGNGLDSFNMIMYNAVRTYTIGGDFFAEKIRNARSELRNLKPLNPGIIKIKANSGGIINGYEIFPDADLTGNKGDSIKFDADEIFHLAYNRIADQIHGQSVVAKLLPIINMRQEAMNDLRVVFHRYVKPLWVISVDTDDATQIAAFKNKLDQTLEKAENLVVPKDTVASIERISIPQFSTLDPLPWVRMLQKEFLKAEGEPDVVMGGAEDAGEESKILYLTWQQVIEFNQMFLEEQIRAQLGLKVKFEFPASIAPELMRDGQKDPKQNKFGVNPGRDSK